MIRKKGDQLCITLIPFYVVVELVLVYVLLYNGEFARAIHLLETGSLIEGT